MTPDERLTFRAPSIDLQTQMAPWLDAEPGRREALWRDDATAPLIWVADGQAYSPTGLARLILEEAAGKTSQVQGPLYWFNESGQSLVQLADALPPAAEVQLEMHTGKLSAALEPVWHDVDAAVRGLGPDVERRSHVKSLKYYRKRKLCDLLIHGDHLSVYVQGLSTAQHPVGAGIVVGGTPRYVHAQVKNTTDIPALIALVKEAFDKQSG